MLKNIEIYQNFLFENFHRYKDFSLRKHKSIFESLFMFENNQVINLKFYDNKNKYAIT